jgi:hypothetical protein
MGGAAGSDRFFQERWGNLCGRMIAGVKILIAELIYTNYYPTFIDMYI